LKLIENKKLDELYLKKKEFETRKLELEREKLTLLLKIKKITNNNGSGEQKFSEKITKSNRLRIF